MKSTSQGCVKPLATNRAFRDVSLLVSFELKGLPLSGTLFPMEKVVFI